MAKFYEGKLIVREGKCMDCDARIFVFEGGERSRCDCSQTPVSPAVQATREWVKSLSKKSK